MEDSAYMSCDELEIERSASPLHPVEGFLQVEYDNPMDKADDNSKSWKPGRNCGSYLGRGAPISLQSLIILGNIWKNMCALPLNLAQKVSEYLPKVLGSAHAAWRDKVVGQLVGISPKALRKWIKILQKNSWQPPDPASLLGKKRGRGSRELDLTFEASREEELPRPLPDSERIMRNLVRRALFACCENQTGLAFERDLANLLQIVGPEHFGGQLHSRHFYNQVVHISARILENLDGLSFNALLPSLGIPSDVGVMLDPVSLGDGTLARHETVLVICLCLVGRNGVMYTPFFAAPTMGMEGHTGDNLCSLALRGLEEHPAVFSTYALKRRV